MTWLTLGCGGLLAIAAIAGLGLWHYRASLAEGWRRMTATLEELAPVQRKLQQRYPKAQVWVGVARRTGLSGTALLVRIVNAPSMLDGTDDAILDRAREVVAIARAALHDPKGYAVFEVELVSSKGIGITITQTRRFSFREQDLTTPSPDTTSPTVGDRPKTGT